MKSKRIIIIVLVAVLSVSAVLLIGRDYFFPDKPIPVESVSFDYETDILEVDIESGIGAVELKYTVLPENATNKTVTFNSDNSFITVTNDGAVTITGLRNGTVTVVTNDGGKTASISLFANAAGILNLDYDFDANTFEESAENYYIIDEGVLVLYSGQKYGLGVENLTGTTDFSEFFVFEAGTINAKKFTPGIFTVTAAQGGETRQIKIKIVDQAILALPETLRLFNASSKPNFLVKPSNYYLGYNSDYKFDFSVTGKSGIVATEDIVYTVYEITGTTETKLDTFDFSSGDNNIHTVTNIVDFKSYNVLRFLSGAASKKIKLKINYKYDPATDKEFVFNINDGYNAANEADFRAYFDEKNENYYEFVDKSQFKTINLVADFEAQAPDYLKNPDGTLLNTLQLRLRFGGTINSARLYTRVSPVNLFGNFHKIDASKLPLMDKYTGEQGGQEEVEADNGRSVTLLGFGQIATIKRPGDPSIVEGDFVYDSVVNDLGAFKQETAQAFYDAAPKHYIFDLSITGNSGNGISATEGGSTVYTGLRTVSAVTMTYNKLYAENCYFEKVYSGVTVDRASAELKLKNIKITDTAGCAVAVRCTASATLENMDLSNGGFASIYCMAGSSNKLMDRNQTEVFDDIVPGAKAGKSMVYIKGFLNVDNWIYSKGAHISKMGYSAIADQVIGLLQTFYSTYLSYLVKNDANGTSFNFVLSRDEVTSTVNYTSVDLGGVTGYQSSHDENAFMKGIAQQLTPAVAFEAAKICTTGNGQNTVLFGGNVNAGALGVPGMRNALSHFIFGFNPNPGTV